MADALAGSKGQGGWPEVLQWGNQNANLSIS